MQATPTLRDLFEEALTLPADARTRLLSERCQDPALRAELERMLTADATEDELLGAGDVASAAFAIGEAEPAEPLPQGARIGPFELLEVLGEGGSSTVFRAFREVEGVRQYVALKLLARGLYTAEAQRRFRHEREALARLRHPGIARLIEGGVADNGLAYIALELIDGVPITHYAREKNLSGRQRLLLFLQVCRAIESAHRALIVHRDLKPSNVLVTPEGEVKLLDFGIAKLLDDTEDATRTRHQALTPAYAAPEQFTTGAITTATDVYALGGLLCELLTGERVVHTRTPHDVSPDKPHAGPAVQKLRGDLANIVAKATAQEPERRYGSASALADDIERYLDRRPVHAHPPSRWYRAGRFIVRHRGGVALTALLLLAICASLSAALWQAHVARREAQRADATRDFVVDLLRKTAPDVSADKRPDVPTLVYTAATDLPRELSGQPELRTELLYTLGDVLRDMRDLPRSEALLREAERAAAQLPETSPIRIRTEVGLTRTLKFESDYEGADKRITALLALPARALPDDVPRAMLLKIGMAVADGRGEMELAVARGREMLAQYRALCASGDCEALGSATHDFASVLVDADRIAEARGLADEALARKLRGATPFSLADTYLLQSKISLYRGDFVAADAQARKAEALLDSLGNGLRRKPLDPQIQREEILLAEENAGQARDLAASLLAQQRERHDSRCWIAWTETQLARAQLLLGQADGALVAASAAQTAASACHGALVGDDMQAMALVMHARALASAGKTADAESEYPEVVAANARVHADDPLSWPTFLMESMRLAGALGHPGDAVRHARQVLAALDRAAALPAHPWRVEAQLLLAAEPGGAAKIDTPAFRAALAAARAWPIGARLSRQRAALESTR